MLPPITPVGFAEQDTKTFVAFDITGRPGSQFVKGINRTFWETREDDVFSFTVDPSLKLIRSKIEGFLTAKDVMDWSREEQAAVIRLGCQSREFLLFVDTSLCAIQSQAVVSQFQHLIAASTYKARRIAIMQGSSLTKMQTRRIVSGHDYIAHFSDVPSAEKWLFADFPSSDTTI